MKRSYRILLSVLSGILLSLPWLGMPGWTLLIAFLPLFYLDRFFVEKKSEFKSITIFWHAWLAFIIWNLLTTWWIVHATKFGAAMAIGANSFVMASVFWLAHIARRRFDKSLGYISLVVFWISFEFIHYHWDIEWPWLTLGNGFSNQIKMNQWYEYTGVLGGSLWILLINILFFKLLVEFLLKTPLKFLRLNLITIAFFLVTPIIISRVIYSGYIEKVDTKSIVIVQPNIDPYSEEYNYDAEIEKLKNFIRLAHEVTDNETDFIVGPETLFENPTFWNEDEFASNRFLHQINEFIHRYSKAEIVFGVSSHKLYPDEEHATSTARKRDNSIYDLFNTAIFMEKSGDLQIYHKSKLVVGVEKMPFINYLGFLGDLVINIGGTSGSLGRQNEASNFTVNDSLQIAPVICYESVFGAYVADYIRKGAGLIFIITNDGWWKNTPGYKQHFSFARLRAIETRRSIARSANTGISGFINQRGDVLQSTDWWKEGVIQGDLNVNRKITFYVRYGDFIGRISAFISALLILFLISQKLLRKNYIVN